MGLDGWEPREVWWSCVVQPAKCTMGETSSQPGWHEILEGKGVISEPAEDAAVKSGARYQRLG